MSVHITEVKTEVRHQLTTRNGSAESVSWNFSLDLILRNRCWSRKRCVTPVALDTRQLAVLRIRTSIFLTWLFNKMSPCSARSVNRLVFSLCHRAIFTALTHSLTHSFSLSLFFLSDINLFIDYTAHHRFHRAWPSSSGIKTDYPDVRFLLILIVLYRYESR